MPGPEGEKCSDCYFFEKASALSGNKGGTCKVDPPPTFNLPMPGMQPGSVQVQAHATQRPVGPDDWCGQFKPKVRIEA